MCCISGMVLVVLSLCMQEAYFQVAVTLDTSQPFCEKNINLRCTYSGSSSCCSAGRTWKLNGAQIISGGVTTSPSKYSEIINSAEKYFILIISNPDDSDLEKEYKCELGASASTAYTLKDMKVISCGSCAGRDFGYSLIGSVAAVIICAVVKAIYDSKAHDDASIKVSVGLMFITYSLPRIGLSFGISVAVNLLVALLVGFLACHCDCHGEIEFYFILIGFATAIIPGLILFLCCKGGTSESNGSCCPPCRIGQEPTATESNNTNRSGKEAHTLDPPKKKRPLPPLDDKSPVSAEITPRPLPKLPPINKN